jgi:hypothetical protein
MAVNDLEDWDGTLAGVARATADEVLMTPVRAGETGTAAFLGLTMSGRSYWVKVLGNPQGNQGLVTEQIVSAAGRKIEAPVRPTALIDISNDFADWSYSPGRNLPPGVAHGSLLLDNAEDGDVLSYLFDDDNRRRQPAMLALWDWCLGGDEQWLYELSSDKSVWSFDHGFWLTGETGWTKEILTRNVDVAWPLDCPSSWNGSGFI